MHTYRAVFAAFLVCIGLIAVMPHDARAGTPPLGPYTVTDLGTLGGAQSGATGISESGAVTGYAQTGAGIYHPFLYRDGARSDLNALAGNAKGLCIDSSGEVAGYSNTSSSQSAHSHAILDINGTITDLGTFGGLDSKAYGMNNARVIVGQSTVLDGDGHAFLYNGASTIDLGTFGGFTSVAYGINNLGTVVGASDVDSTDTHAFRYDSSTSPATTTDLGTLGGSDSYGRAINDLGQIVGDSTTSSGATHAFTDDVTGRMLDMGTLSGGTYSHLYALNNQGVAVGQGDANKVAHAIYEYNNALHDLNSLLEPNSGWVLTSATSINSAGQIVGVGNYTNPSTGVTVTHAFLMSPPAPLSYTLTDLGTLGGPSEAYAVSDAGYVAATSFLTTGHYEAFIEVNGLPSALGFLPGGADSEAVGVNDKGMVVGFGETDTGDEHAFYADSAGLHDIGMGGTNGNNGLGGSQSAAYAINDNGDIVGEAEAYDPDTNTYITKAFFVPSLTGGMNNIDGTYNVSGAYAISQDDQIAGYTYSTDDGTGNFVAAMWLGGSSFAETLGFLPGGSESAAYGINEDAVCAGYSTTYAGTPHAVIFGQNVSATLAVNRDIGTLGGTDSYAYSINSSDQVVGYSSTDTGLYHGFLLTRDGMIDLNTLLPASAAGWTVEYAYGINDGSEIAAVGIPPASVDATGNAHAILLKPPVPTFRYAITEVGSLNSANPNTTGAAINTTGQITGQSENAAGYFHAFLWTPGGQAQDLGDLDGGTGNSNGTAVNDAGNVCGSSTTSNGATEPFNYTSATGMIDINPAPASGDYCPADGITPANTVVGEYSSADVLRSFEWNSSGWNLINMTTQSNALAVNGSQHMVGQYQAPDGYYQSFFCDLTLGTSAPFLDLTPDLNENGYASAINASDHIVLNGIDALLYDGGRHVLGWQVYEGVAAAAINDTDQIVGAANSNSGPYDAYLWHGATSVDLNSLSSSSGWQFSNAAGINAAGWIAADGTDPNGKTACALLKPPAITTTASLNGASGSGGWYHGPVIVTLSSAIANDTVAYTAYKLDSGPWDRYSAPLTVAGDGTHTVQYYGVDKVGDQETTKSTTVKIDTVAPVSAGTAAAVAMGTQVAITATDASSGVASISYILDGGSTTTYTAAFTIVNGGSHHVEYWATDVAGNAETPHHTLDFTTVVHLAGVTISPASVVGGASATGTIMLAGTTDTGVTVTLGSSATGVGLPASVSVATGQKIATFPVTTQPVAATLNATITATLTHTTGGNDVETAALQVVLPSLVSVSVVPGTLSSNSSTGIGTVTLNGVVAGTAVPVTLSSSNSLVTLAPVSVSPGQATGTFAVSVGTVTAAGTATISATLNGTTKTTKVTLTKATAPITSLTFSSSSFTGGATVTGTVTLSRTAPSGGETISLVSSNSGAVSVPASVTIASGATQGTFTATSTATTATETVFVTASSDASSVSATLTVLAPALTSITVAPSSVTSGTAATGTVTLSGKVAAGANVLVTLTSNGSAAIVPGNVLVPAGQSSATFPITTGSVSVNTAVTITAVYASVTKTASLTVTPSGSAASSVGLNPSSVTGGASSTGTVTLAGAAPTGGQVVALTSNNLNATLPANVTVLAGATTATFTVTTKPVTANTSATISATAGAKTVSAMLTINAPVLTSVTVSPSSVIGGAGATGTVTLSGPPAAGTSAVVTLSRNNASATVPAAVTIPAGATTATFPVTTSAVTSASSATLTAVYAGVTKTATLGINPPLPAPSTVTLSAVSVTGGQALTGTVALAVVAPTGGVTVTLSSSSASAIVPKSVTVAAGTYTVTFTVTTVPVAADTSVTITAATTGGTATASLVVNAPVVTKVTLSPSTVPGGGFPIGTVTLSGVVASGTATVLLTSNSAAASVPDSVAIPAGVATGTFTISTEAVTTKTTATITATYGGPGQSATLTIAPALSAAAVTGISLNPTSVIGALPVTGTVTLHSAAPTGGETVVLASDNPAATVLPGINIAAGQTTGTFMVSTSTVTANTSVTISATAGGATVTAPLTLTPFPAGTITSISPTSGPIGTVVTITGTNFYDVTRVRFHNASAVTYSVNAAATQVTVTVPAGAATGTITVNQPGSASVTSAQTFTVTASSPPTIASFTPTSGPVGATVTITGTNFTGATAVWFNGIAATAFAGASATQITATVPSSATTGTISIRTAGGTATSAQSFTVTANPAPTITSFTPASGVTGTVVTVTGTNLNGVTAVRFHNANATVFSANSGGTQLTVTVPASAGTGTFTVTTPSGSVTSAGTFTVVPAPSITSISPTSGPVGTMVIITGTNFVNVTRVRFHNADGAYTVNSPTQITVPVPSGAGTGTITVDEGTVAAISAQTFTVTAS